MKIIQIEITNACVHTCSNCTRFCGHHPKPFFMDYDTFTRAVDSMDGFQGIVGIMGGEPTIHPQFARFVEYFRTHFGKRDCTASIRRPTRDFVGYVVKNLFDIDHSNQRGLWSSVGKKYYEHFEIIQDTFGYQALNDHTNPSMHETLTVTRKELGIPDEEWFKLRDACWIQNIWSASITPKGAFFCEVAAAMDMLLGGPGGWPIEPGWWKRSPKEFGDQLQWCELCSAPLAMPKRDAREGIDEVSPVWHQKFKELGSPKLRKGLVRVFDVARYNAADHDVINEALPYLKDQSLRIGKSNEALYPRSLKAVLVLPKESDAAAAERMVDQTRSNVELLAVVCRTATHRQVVQSRNLAMLDGSCKSGEELMEGLRELEGWKDWLVVLQGVPASESLTQSFTSYVCNPGCLYLGPQEREAEGETPVGFSFVNRRAQALRTGGSLDDLRASYPSDKVVPLEVDVNRRVKIYVAYHADTARLANSILTPIHVGKAAARVELDMLGDDTGENISRKNANFAELTAQYWAWKNDHDGQYVGLMHYRRAMVFAKGHEKKASECPSGIPIPALSTASYARYGWREADILEALEDCDLVLPMAYDVRSTGHRTVAQHFIHHHGEGNYREFRRLLDEHCPEYREDTRRVFDGSRVYLCNMFVMRRELFDRYSQWLFGLLDKFVGHLNPEELDAYQVRMPAYMAERLLNLFVRKLRREEPGIRIKEVPYVFVENTDPAPQPLPAASSSLPVVPIVTAFDTRYVPCAGAWLASLLDHVSQDRYYDLIVLEDGVSKSNKALLDLMVREHPNVGLRYLSMAGFFEGESHAHFSKSTFNRLKLAEFLPHYDKVVYIDPDTIVLRDLAELFDHDVAGQYAAAALDYSFKFMIPANVRVWPQFGGTTVREYLTGYLQLGDAALQGYFNAGVMVFNLEKIRNDGLTQRFQSLFEAKPYYCVDQDILNKAFDGNVLHVDPRWNIIVQPLEHMKKMPPRYYREYMASRDEPYVIHYAGQAKPWNSVHVDFSEHFWLYCRKSPFYESVLLTALDQSFVREHRRKAGAFGLATVRNGDSDTAWGKLRKSLGERLYRFSPRIQEYCYQAYHALFNRGR